jgi:hypothetical protein
MDLSSSTEALPIWSDGYSAAGDSARVEAWLEILVVGGGDVNCGVGGVGVLAAARKLGTCDDGGGVIEEAARGTGEVKSAPSCEAEGWRGVSGREMSADDMRESWVEEAWESILPSRERFTAGATRQKAGRRFASAMFALELLNSW